MSATKYKGLDELHALQQDAVDKFTADYNGLARAVQMLAADNCHLIDITLIADRLVAAIALHDAYPTEANYQAVLSAVEAYGIARRGN